MSINNQQDQLNIHRIRAVPTSDLFWASVVSWDTQCERKVTNNDISLLTTNVHDYLYTGISPDQTADKKSKATFLQHIPLLFSIDFPVTPWDIKAIWFVKLWLHVKYICKYRKFKCEYILNLFIVSDYLLNFSNKKTQPTSLFTVRLLGITLNTDGWTFAYKFDRWRTCL